jgi:hypothetical protein
MSSIVGAVVSSLFVAAVCTIGDWVWASQLLTHKMWYGLAHGAGMCLAMGLALGAPAGRPIVGAMGGVVSGLLGAGSFYVLAPLLRGAGLRGYAAMYLSWFLLWIFIGYLAGPILRRTSAAAALVRGVVAAVTSGLAFYLVSGMWTNWNPATINYLDHFARWTIAFLPGFLALRVGREKGDGMVFH